MNVGSLFSGVGGLDEGLRRAGHRHVFFCESNAYRRDVLRARFPGVPVYDDVRSLRCDERFGIAPSPNDGTEHRDGDWPSQPPDLLCGGFPCQDLSVAGRRAGLAGDRSGLFFEFARIIESVRPGWLLIENVPGLLSSNGGRDFGVVLGTLADLGYGVAWRILDSRFFGVPQRRRRVFIVGAFADGDPRAAAERAGEVLAVGQGCLRHLAPRGKAGQDVAYALADGSGNRTGSGRDGQDTMIAYSGHGEGEAKVANALKVPSHGASWSGGSSDTFVAGPLDTRQTPQGHGMAGVNDQAVANNHVVAAPLTKGSATGKGVNQPGRRQEDDVNLVPIAGPLGGGNDGIGRRTEDDPNLVTAFSWQQGDDSKFNPDGRGRSWVARAGDYAAGLSASGRHDAISGESVGVRRLTPTECERLQGFADGWTQLGETPDSRRYSALGDAVTVNVSAWIGARLSLLAEEAS